MGSHTFVQCDVFTDRRFEGNPLAVFPDARGLDDDSMQRIAREMNLSETVFVFPPRDPNQALRRLRIFTPARELPVAGHPVVGTWNVLARRGVVPAPPSGTGAVTIHQELLVGVLPVTVEFADGAPIQVVMSQPSPVIGPRLLLATQAAEALGLTQADIDEQRVPVLVASTGVPFLLVPLRSRDALRRLCANGTALSVLLRQSDAHGLYAYTMDSGTPLALVSARMVSDAALGIAEDPATGIAAGPLAATLVHHGAIAARDGVARFAIEQGADIGRRSTIMAEIDVDAGGVRGVRIAGSAVEVLRGELDA